MPARASLVLRECTPTTPRSDHRRYPGRFIVKISRYVVLASLVCFAASAAVAQVNDTYIIPIVGSVSGANNTRWSSELYVFNPQRHALRVTAVYLPSGGGQGPQVDFVVQPNQTAFATNLVDDLFDLSSGTGGLILAVFPEKNPGVPNDALSRSFVASTKNFNNASSGTFSQQVAGVWAGLQDVDFDGISAISSGVRENGTLLTGYRTNVGAVNLGRGAVRVLLDVFDANGAKVGSTLALDVPPLGHIQDRLPVAVSVGSIEFYVQDPFVDDPNTRAMVFPYATVIDNRSGDPLFLSPTLLAAAGELFKDGTTARRSQPKQLDLEMVRRATETAKALGEARLVPDAETGMMKIVR